MAGTIMMRRERDGHFHARLNFVCEGVTYEDKDRLEGIGQSAEIALADLVPKLPPNLQMRVNGLDRWTFYNSPEYIDIADKCVDLDGHRPTREEWRLRRSRFLREVELGHVKSSWGDLSFLLDLFKK